MKDIPIGARSITCLPPSSGRPGRLPCRAILPNRDQVLVPGNFVRVRVGAADEHDSLLVPDAALGSDQGGRYLLVLDKENVVEQRKVTIGPKVGDLRVIESGLKPNGRIVVAGIMRRVRRSILSSRLLLRRRPVLPVPDNSGI